MFVVVTTLERAVVPVIYFKFMLRKLQVVFLFGVSISLDNQLTAVVDLYTVSFFVHLTTYLRAPTGIKQTQGWLSIHNWGVFLFTESFNSSNPSTVKVIATRVSGVGRQQCDDGIEGSMQPSGI